MKSVIREICSTYILVIFFSKVSAILKKNYDKAIKKQAEQFFETLNNVGNWFQVVVTDQSVIKLW